MGGGYWVTVMIHLDDSQVKYKTENDDFDHNHSPGDQTHLSMTVTGPSSRHTCLVLPPANYKIPFCVAY